MNDDPNAVMNDGPGGVKISDLDRVLMMIRMINELRSW
jgi:hypothetical protein